ncbi:prepilin-type N-terminal cleavage/methylation domain-containing protein [Pseudomonas nitroreducens]|uniref:Prepilin-type N-terminal cleavage/methylation domain-containing protein n=1 Tax=Pseudomonas nitroreducens TaxID=46680 RepID=A0A5R9AGI4_PSENT|nr:prepilin-type N-terminal cleavage/methylation domain-containing protein [Pseudomonas nitroreducens]TLP77831.1 prepilin-type N-terminal cleavage/methylation domain-containing protein [Pseudomonas nitroreducens]
MTTEHSLNRQRGLSMIELMVALLLSSLLLLGVMQMFSNSSLSDKTSSALTRVQDSGRVVLDLVSMDARRAGYQGCQLPSSAVTLSNGVKFPRDAITTTNGVNTSVTFNYATTTTTSVAMPGVNKTCTNQTLYLYSVTYSNCANGTSICMNSSTSSGTQTVVDNATITGISLGYQSAGNVIWKTAGSISSADVQSADRLQLSITASDATQNISRNFTGTVELRNRL